MMEPTKHFIDKVASLIELEWFYCYIIVKKECAGENDLTGTFFIYTFIALALSAPIIAEATAITTFRILSQIDFFISF